MRLENVRIHFNSRRRRNAGCRGFVLLNLLLGTCYAPGAHPCGWFQAPSISPSSMTAA